MIPTIMSTPSVKRGDYNVVPSFSSASAPASRLTLVDANFDCGIRPEALAVNRMMLRVPVPDAPLDIAEKVEATLLCQVPEVADQVCDGMLIAGVAVSLKYGDGLGGPRDVVGFIGHASHRSTRAKNRRRI